jgi:predicted adenine nucleotide alpha hydrolase (AANH) superfamily ATPase
MRLLLHACCGPCLIEPLNAYRSNHDVTVFYANPNIQPVTEFEHRRDVLATYAEATDVAVVLPVHEPDLWVAGTRQARDRRERCHACYRIRLGMTARAAAESGFEAFATTLTVSPYQDPDSILRAGEAVAAEAGVHYVHTDFRSRYREAQKKARDLGMYRQNYCGCLPSKGEAEAERSERKAARAASRWADASDGPMSGGSLPSDRSDTDPTEAERS